MNPEDRDVPMRLSDEACSVEQELLRSAARDRPAPAVYSAALARVLSAGRRERTARNRRRFMAVGAALAVAAGAFLLERGQPPAKLAAEPPVMVKSASAAAASAVAPPPLVPCTPIAVGSGREPLIDDFEDGDTRIPVIDKRAGSWIVYNDGTSKQEPHPGSIFPSNRIPGGRGASHFGLRSTGGKFSKWGAALAIELNPRRCYDASAYAGLTFWARGRATLRVGVKMTQIVGEEFGGSCTKGCYDSHGTVYSLTREWKRYDVRWKDLEQRGFGTAVSFDPRSLYSFEFAVSENQPPFDFWIDDVAFLQ